MDDPWRPVPPVDPAALRAAIAPRPPELPAVLFDPDAERAARTRLAEAIVAQAEAEAATARDAEHMRQGAAQLAAAQEAFNRFDGLDQRLAQTRAARIRAGDEGLPSDLIELRRQRDLAAHDLRELEGAFALLKADAEASAAAARDAAERVTRAAEAVVCHQVARLLDRRQAVLDQLARIEDELLAVSIRDPHGDDEAMRIIFRLRSAMIGKPLGELARARPQQGARWRAFLAALRTDADAVLPPADA